MHTTAFLIMKCNNNQITHIEHFKSLFQENHLMDKSMTECYSYTQHIDNE